MTQQLIRYDAAIRALAECKAVDEAKDWHDKAAAMQAYGRIAKDKTLETDAAEIRIRAERRLGEILASTEKNTGAKGVGKSAVTSGNRTPTLAESGIEKRLSVRAQKLAAVPEAQFAAAIGEWRERVTQEGERVTANLEAAGAKFMADKPTAKATTTPTTKATPPAAPDAPANAEAIANLEEQVTTARKTADELIEDNESMGRVFDANDQVAASVNEATRYREENRILRERINGLMHEKNEYIKLAKSWQRKCAALEKQLNETAATEF